jgi:GNAT superfamily N-acetyltransferase
VIVVERVASPRALEELLALGPERQLVGRRLDAAHEPFWRHAARELFLARDARTRRPVGRIAAIANHNHDAVHADGAGFFGWLETPDDLDAARALVEAAAQWLRERGYRRLRGPLHLGLGEAMGLLVEGFDRPADALTPWNAPYLPGLLARLGFGVHGERHGYAWSRSEMPPPPASLRSPPARSGGVVYRQLDPAAREAEAVRFLAAYNAAHAANPDFVPLTEDEARARLRDIMTFGDPRLVWLAEVKDEPAGIVIAMPAIDDFGATRGGEGALGTLRALRAAFARRRVERAHLVTIAVEPRFRGLHVGAQLLVRAWRAALDLGVREAELSGVDPGDEVMQQMLWRFGCKRVRRFRVVELAL